MQTVILIFLIDKNMCSCLSLHYKPEVPDPFCRLPFLAIFKMFLIYTNSNIEYEQLVDTFFVLVRWTGNFCDIDGHHCPMTVLVRPDFCLSDDMVYYIDYDRIISMTILGSKQQTFHLNPGAGLSNMAISGGYLYCTATYKQ